MENKQTISNNDSGELPEIKEWDFSRHYEYLNEIGKKYPREFLEVMGDAALHLVWQWMNKNDAPKEITDILGDGHTLIINARIHPDWKDFDLRNKSEIPDMLSRITSTLYQNGYCLEPDESLMYFDKVNH